MHISSQVKKDIQEDIVRLEQKFNDLCKKLKKNPSSVPTSSLDTARLALNLALTARADKHVKWVGDKFYLKKDKIDKIAPKLSPKHTSYSLLKIRQADGTFLLNPQRILNSFQDYYSDLYKANVDVNLSQIGTFPDNISFPALTEDHIGNLKGGSAPDPDSFSVPY